MEILKDIFYFIGSILGIIAFFDSVIKPIMDYNHSKWILVEDKIQENFFLKIRDDLGAKNGIYVEDLDKLNEFYNDFKDNRNYLQFKFPVRKKVEQHFQRLCELIDKFRGKVNSNKFRGFGESHFVNDNRIKLSDTFFRDKYSDIQKADKKYLEYRNELFELITEMRIEFASIETLANLKFSEVPFKKSIVKRRTKNLLNE